MKCPMNPSHECPFYNARNPYLFPYDMDDYDDYFDDDYYDYFDDGYYDDDLFDYYDYFDDNDFTRQSPQEINRMMNLINRQFSNYYTELQGYRVPRWMVQNIFRNIVSYVLQNQGNYTGAIPAKTNQLLNSMRRDMQWAFTTLRGFGVPNNRINEIFRDIIRFILENIDDQVPVPPTPPVTGWSQWEDLGGVLTSAPAVASWQPNRLDVFARGQNNALWHKWWDGSRWSNWEDLGGVLTSAPAAVSWGPNRIDVFGRGQNQSLWHKWWDGTRWSDWEDLGGGIINSGPAASSTGVNRLEVFAQGQRGDLLMRTWNGTRWSNWQSLGGVITSEPAAVSWGGNRLDVFARGRNNALWHIWRS